MPAKRTPRKPNQEIPLPARVAPNMPPQTIEERTFKMEGIIYCRDDVTMTVFVQDMTGVSSESTLIVEWEEHLKRLGYYLYRFEVEPPTDEPAKRPQA